MDEVSQLFESFSICLLCPIGFHSPKRKLLNNDYNKVMKKTNEKYLICNRTPIDLSPWMNKWVLFGRKRIVCWNVIRLRCIFQVMLSVSEPNCSGWVSIAYATAGPLSGKMVLRDLDWDCSLEFVFNRPYAFEQHWRLFGANWIRGDKTVFFRFAAALSPA